MEFVKISGINETWKLCTIAGLIGLILLAIQTSDSITTFNNVPLTTVQTSKKTTNNSNHEIQPFNSSAFEDKLFLSSSEADPSFPGTEYNIQTDDDEDSFNISNMVEDEKHKVLSGEAKSCRMYEGRWVYKPEENPRYHTEQCSFVEDKMSCRRNGRPDFEYEGWGWEPHACHIPLFNGTDMLERLRGKRMIIIGDSLNRNQWESLACLLYTSIPPYRSFVDAAGYSYKVLKVKDYDFTLEFYWAPFLVNLEEDDKSGMRVLSLDKLVPSSEKWRGADVMVFNSGHWWTHNFKIRAWDVFEYKGRHIKEMGIEVAYERALSVWAEWLAQNTDPIKTKVYFRSISPEHKNKQWCFNHKHLINDTKPYVQEYPRRMIDVVERKIKEMNNQDVMNVPKRVRYLNITGLSIPRIDAHPSIYRFRSWKVIVERYKRLIEPRSDCSHWCLPGLPDTWNRILYASLFFDHLSPSDSSTS